MRRFTIVVVVLVLAGCALPLPPAGSPSATALLERGDQLSAAGRWADALHAYDELLNRHPDDPLAAQARTRRGVLAQLLALRAEIERMAKETTAYQAQIGKMREELQAKEAEIVRVRRELNDRQGEADRLRADLERLKEIDLRLERPRQ